MKLKRTLIVSMVALLLLCSSLVASAGPPGHSRYHHKHDKHDKHWKHHKGHKYDGRDRRHDPHDHHDYYVYDRYHYHVHDRRHYHMHDHIVIVPPPPVRSPDPGVDVRIKTGGVAIEGEVLF